MAVITVGNFDGVHCGHRVLLNKLCSVAASKGEKSIAVTFNRHPRKNTKLLCDNASKEKMIRAVGVDEVVFLDFDEVSELSGDEFLSLLKEKFALSVFVCGSDFRFGKNAACDVSFLLSRAESMDFAVETVEFDPETKVSSSAVRTLLAEGNVEKAAELLGYEYSVTSAVVGGKKLGRKLGYPTVNISPDEKIRLPRRGVYSTDLLVSGRRYKAVTNVGVRPTVDFCGKENVETFVLEEFDCEITEATVVFKKFLREEKKFASLDELSAQISVDVAAAAAIV